MPAVGPGDALAQQVHRCVDAEGRTVFSDRRCIDIGAAPRIPPATQDAGEPRRLGSGCPRTLGDLVAELGAAIRNNDVNRLSSLYDWAGHSNAAAGRTLDRLESIAARPLVDIVPVYPGNAYEDDGAAPQAPTDPPADAPMASPVAPPPRPRPTALRLEQTLANGSTPSRTVFGLRRSFGCFWVRL